MSLAYEDPWYYNNYHVLGSIFVFPHYLKVTFYDAENSFKSLDHSGVDFDWYKNDEQNGSTGGQNQPQKKFVILKNSDKICYDNGKAKIQVYQWVISESKLVFEKLCSLN